VPDLSEGGQCLSWSLVAPENNDPIQALPELEALRSVVERNDWHNDDACQQSLRLFYWVKWLPASLPEIINVPETKLHALLTLVKDPARGHHTMQALLGFAALIHDVGKAKTFQRLSDGTTRCPDHEAVSGDMAPTLCARFDFTPAETCFITNLIGAHGQPYTFFKDLAALPTSRQQEQIRGFETMHADHLLPLLLLAWGDLVTSDLRAIRPEKYETVLDFYRGWLQSVWPIWIRAYERVGHPMKLTLVEKKIQQTIRKNTATSYGLTLVTGLPFPTQIGHQVQDIQQQLETLAPGRFTWYALDHLHATLVAPLRGRYRDSPPLQREELPANLQSFTQDLATFFAQHQPFALVLAGVHISENGFVLVGENTFEQQLASALQRFPELDKPKSLKGFHVAIGFCNTSWPFAKDEQAAIETALSKIEDTPIGSMEVRQVWLVHYANRTLNRIIGKVPFTLGQTNALTAEYLLQGLGIKN
jgi:hypothetical protein